MPKGRILAVDDQRYFRELIEGTLAEQGFEVRTASSGDEALAILEQSVFDVVITDLVMPVMNGTELVQRVKERDPEQDIVVVTGVVDVKSAVDAMRLGATDYLLKPYDRDMLVASLESILQRRRLSTERDRLLAENIEYLGERSLFARALGLFSLCSRDALGEKVLEGLCEETGAQGGVLWLAPQDGGSTLELAAARGLVRIEEEREHLEIAELHPALRGGAPTLVITEREASEGPRPALFTVLRQGGHLHGLLRLTDKAGGESFDEVDRLCVEKFVPFAEAALANAERFRALERRALRDPETGAYHFDYLLGVIRTEVERANRFGRSFGVLKISLDPTDALRQQLDETRYARWFAGLSKYVARLLRATDLLALGDDGSFWVLVAETDAIGAASFKQRTRLALERCEALAAVQEPLRPAVHLGCVTYPGDASQLEALVRELDTRIEDDRRSRVRDRELDGLTLTECLQRLLAAGETEAPEGPDSLVPFALSELGRRPRERNLLFFHPGDRYPGALREWLDARRGGSYETDVVVIGQRDGQPSQDERVAWVPADRIPGCPPFLVHFGEGPPYAMLCADKPEAEGLRLYHTGERGLVEYLAFRLQRELHVPRLS
jgi:diguanylate cyclase (GGDEF)-like protein